jgi:hypothetical protein
MGHNKMIGQEQIGPLAGDEIEQLLQLRDEINKRLPNHCRDQADQPERLLFIGDTPLAVQWLKIVN